MNLLKVTAAQAGRWSSIAAAFFLGFLLAALCFVALTFGQTARIYPSWLHYASFIVVGVGIWALMCLRYRLRIAVCTGIGFLVSILVLFHCDATPAKAFRRLDAAIQHGMTVAEVRSAVQREFPPRGRLRVPVMFESVPGSQIGDEVVLFTDSQYVHIIDSGFEFNIFVSFRNGRVIDKQSNVAPGSGTSLPTTLAIVTALAFLLCCLSARHISAANRSAGHGLDAASLAERLQRVRSDYLGAYRTRHHLARHRRDLLASAGLAVRRFPYFRGRAGESSEDSEDERGNA